MKTVMLGGCLLLLANFIDIVQPTCVLESDFGFKINCAFKKSGLFRVRNLGGIKAHASLGFSLGDELGFEQSLTNQDPSRRRSVNVKNGAPPNLIAEVKPTAKQEKRGKQNRIMMRPVAPAPSRPNPAAMDKLSTLHRRGSTTMQPIVVQVPTMEIPKNPTITQAKPMRMGIPPFRPLPSKEDTLKVLPITSSTRKNYTPLQIPQSKGPGLAYQSEIYPSNSHISNTMSQMTAVHFAPFKSPIVVDPQVTPTIKTVPFVPMPISPASSVTSVALSPSLALTEMKAPNLFSNQKLSIQKTNPISNFLDPVPHQVHQVANYAYNTKKVDDYNTITGYGDDTTLKFNKEDINAKIAEIAKAGNISMEAVEAAIALRQQQLLNKYASFPVPSSTTSTTTSTTQQPVGVQFEPEPEIVVASIAPRPQQQRIPTSGKVMNAPKEYYPVGYEKNFDDHFQSKVDLPDTNFHCGDQKYFPGLYGDESLGCMVFHVCALTDDGLVMKSFLCPESTLFDQTILKCNWWFYVDCKNTRKLYDTNIPVSKSYQLMKALTFFSSYKKEMDDNRPTNPEDVEGIKEAITILENQNKPQIQNSYNQEIISAPGVVQIITPQSIVDERTNKKHDSSESSPVYRGNRNLNNNTKENNQKPSNTEQSNQKPSNIDALKVTGMNPEGFKLVTVNADMNFNGNKSTEAERKHRRRMTLRYTNSTSKPPLTSTSTIYVTPSTEAPTTTNKPITTFKREALSSSDIRRHDVQPIQFYNVKPETLNEELGAISLTDASEPLRRFYRSSSEHSSKETAMVNNEKVQIVRPTSSAKLVGHFETQRDVIDKLDEAVLGNLRFKKDTVTIITPERRMNINNQT
ncbi:hypothetical protein K1T71_012345 [Dendrolimus kikuchii]|uniref:Uncharacterized protein n=1 Tax=Dendrolimus kikuchii TaxID=765133 RepID=A0ACC1CLK9_9NEOP|nr:hypothetical protein K1T71_012345 [Dendrolimus kikuchii]